jgi:acetyl-CoA C-acetyltransferase
MSTTSNTPVIVSAIRTPIGKYNKSLKSLSAPQLGSLVIKEALSSAKIDKNLVNEVIMGQVLQAGSGQAPARQSALYAGLSYDVSAVTVNKVCGSGLKAVMLGAQAIKAGDAEIIVAGGQESMSNVPYYLQNARRGYYYGNGELIDGLEYDGLLDPYNKILMGITGEIVAERYSVTRNEADEFALQSHQKALKAKEWLKSELIPIFNEKKEKLIEYDEGPRSDTSLEKLATLKPAFKKNGVVTAGNASGLNDGAAAVVIMKKSIAEDMQLKPLAEIKSYNTVGVKPEYVMEAPINGVKKLLEKNRLKIDDIDLVEHNEAFASASIAVKKELGIPDDIFNVNGGAVALGHPLGCSGARILVTLIHELQRSNKNRGIATLCLGGGNAVSMLIEKY